MLISSPITARVGSNIKEYFTVSLRSPNGRQTPVQQGDWFSRDALQFIHNSALVGTIFLCHGEVIKWKHFPRYWPFVRGIHRSPVNSPYKGQWRGALMFLWFVPEQTGEYNRDVRDLRRHQTHYDVTIICVCGSANHTGGNTSQLETMPHTTLTVP